jgi:serine/threonine protein kinase
MPKYDQLPKEYCPFTMTRHLLYALEGLHNTGRVHNDIKPENVVCDKRANSILIDFGMSQKFSSKAEESQFLGNLMFASTNKLSF